MPRRYCSVLEPAGESDRLRPNPRGSLESFESLNHTSQLYEHNPAIVVHIADAVSHLQRGEVALREGVGFECILVATHGLKAYASILVRQGEQHLCLRRRLGRPFQSVEDDLPGVQSLDVSPQFIKNVDPPYIRA